MSNGKFNGYGRQIYYDWKTFYEGYFKNGKRHGPGKIVSNKTEILKGYWI
jgi:hypothetical protein